MEQQERRISRNSEQLAAMAESLKSAHKRIDEIDRVVDSIHKMAGNIEALTLQVMHLNEIVDNSVNRLEASLRSQGERIGALEKLPGERWKSLVTQLISLAVAAVAGGAFSRFFS